MEFIKICMNCGNEFETDEFFDETLNCPKCLSADVYQPKELDYYDISPEECFIMYHKNKIAYECNADKKEINLVEE